MVASVMGCSIAGFKRWTEMFRLSGKSRLGAKTAWSKPQLLSTLHPGALADPVGGQAQLLYFLFVPSKTSGA